MIPIFDKFARHPKILKVLIGIILFTVFCYCYFWRGIGDNQQLRPLQTVFKGCYVYNDDDDLKNIARHIIAQKYGNQVLATQRILSVHDGFIDNFYAVTGRPYGALKLHYLEKNRIPYPTTEVMFIDHYSLRCVEVDTTDYTEAYTTDYLDKPI